MVEEKPASDEPEHVEKQASGNAETYRMTSSSSSTTSSAVPPLGASSPTQRKSRKNGIPGSPPPDVDELARAEDRLSFAYFEHCTVGRKDNAVTVTDETGVIHIPAATVSVLMLGPGSRVTHQAMTVLSANGVTVLWVGERGICMRTPTDTFVCATAETSGARLEYEEQTQGRTNDVPDAIPRGRCFCTYHATTARP